MITIVSASNRTRPYNGMRPLESARCWRLLRSRPRTSPLTSGVRQAPGSASFFARGLRPEPDFLEGSPGPFRPRSPLRLKEWAARRLSAVARRQRLVVVEEDALRGAVEVVELARPQRPEKGEEAGQPET